MSESLEVYKRTFEREREARKAAEQLLEKKSHELYLANEKLQQINSSLEMVVQYRTQEGEKAKTLLYTILQNLPFGIWVEDENRKIVFANTHLCQLFRLSKPAEHWIGEEVQHLKNALKSFFNHPTEFIQKVEELLATQKTLAGFTLELANGKLAELDYFPIVSEIGITGVFGNSAT